MGHDYDYIIIGSGFGGSVSALRLSEKGYKVLVIEKGKWYKPNDFAKIGFDATALLLSIMADDKSQKLSQKLMNQAGFVGFSGQFKLTASGQTERIFEIRRVFNNALTAPLSQ